MLWCDSIDQRRGLTPIGDDQDSAVGLPAGARDVGPWQMFEMPSRGGFDSSSKVAGICDKDRLRRSIMLGLRQQIGGDPGRVVFPIGDNQDLRGAGNHVDADTPKNAPLGGSDVG